MFSSSPGALLIDPHWTGADWSDEVGVGKMNPKVLKFRHIWWFCSISLSVFQFFWGFDGRWYIESA